MVWIERRQRPATLNEMLGAHLHARRAHTREWRTWAREAAAGDRPITGPVTVTVRLYRATASSRPDAASCVLAAKAVVDGLVDAGVLPDGDGPDVVLSTTFEAPTVAGYDGMRVIVRAIEEHATRPQPAVGQLPLPGES